MTLEEKSLFVVSAAAAVDEDIEGCLSMVFLPPELDGSGNSWL